MSSFYAIWKLEDVKTCPKIGHVNYILLFIYMGNDTLTFTFMFKCCHFSLSSKMCISAHRSWILFKIVHVK